MKRLVSFVLAAVLTLLACSLLFSCKSDIADFEPEPFDTEKPVTITFYHTMGAVGRDVLNKYIEKFQKMYPNITVEHKSQGDYDGLKSTINTELINNDEPDIAYCYADHVALYNLTGKVVPLDSLIAYDVTVKDADGNESRIGLTDEQKNDFIKTFFEEGSRFEDGKMYMLPFSKSTEVLFYNKDFFEANNLSVPTTWDEMEAVCKRIKEIDPKCIPLGYDSESNWFITMCAQLGSDYTSLEKGNHFLFDNETNRNFVKRFNDWYNKGYVITKQLNNNKFASSLFTAKGDDKKAYMCIGSTAGGSYQLGEATDGVYPFEVGITSIPQADMNNKKVISQGPSVCLFNKGDKQKVMAAWLFMKYLTTDTTFQVEFAMKSGGYIPVLNSAKEHTVYKSFLDKANGTNFINALAAKACYDQADIAFTSPVFNGSSDARDAVGSLLAKCLPIKPGATLDEEIAKAFKDSVEECEYKTGG